MRLRSILVVLLMLLSGPASVATAAPGIGEESEPVEETSRTEVVVPGQPRMLPARGPAAGAEVLPPRVRTVRPLRRLTTRTPRAPGGFLIPLRC